jgi:hypothetical protein
MPDVCPKLPICLLFLTLGRVAFAQDALPEPGAAAPETSASEPAPKLDLTGTSPAAPPPPQPAASEVGPSPAAPPAATDVPATPVEQEFSEARAGITGICGKVVEKNSKEPLIEAEVRVVKGGARSARSDLDGRYALPLPPGEYDIRAFYELHRPRRVGAILVRHGECTVVNFPLAADADAVEEVVVEARADARREAALLAERKKAVPVSDAVSAQEISRTPDSSASDAVKRVVSATVVDNKYVFLRGLGGRYSGVLLNGVVLPSPDPDEHSVPLDLFPTSLLANLTVLKTYTPDLPGNFGGGVLQIETTPYPTSFELKLKLTGSADSVTTSRKFPTYRGGSLDLLGYDDGGRGLPSAVPTTGPARVGQGGLTPADLERIGESFSNNWKTRMRTAPPNFGVTATIGDTVAIANRTAGYVATVGYGTKWSARSGSVAKVSVDTATGQLSYREQLSATEAGSSTNVSALVNAGIDLSPDDQLSVLALYTHTGETRTGLVQGFSEGDAQDITSSRLQFKSRSLLFGQLKGRHGLKPFELEWQGNASLTTSDEPDTRDVVHHVLSDGLLFKNGPGSGTRFSSELEDVNGGGGVDLALPLGDSRLRAGATVQASSRRFDARRFRFTVQDSADPAVLRLPIEEMLSPAHIGPDFLLQEETLQSDAYDASLAVYSGYLVADWAATSRLRAVAGARYEIAQQKLTPGTRFAINPTPEPGSSRTDRDILPGVNVTYALRTDMNLRAAYSYTLARPQFRELAPFNYFDFARRRSISGNPALETTRIHNVDGRWEWFPGEDEVLAASVFGKKFDKPIERAVVSSAQGDLLYVNAPEATVLGTEIEARVGLGRIAGILRRLRAAGNLSLIRSEVDFGGRAGPQTSDRRALQGQSPFVANAALIWDAPFAFEITALYNVYGRRISEAGRDGQPDIYEQPFHRVDLAISRVFATSWKLKAAASNLLDSAVVLKQADLLVQRYRPGVAGSLSLEWSY